MSILLTEEEIEAMPVTNLGGNFDDLNLVKATGKKILPKLQAIYNIPDLGTSDRKMGEFIESLLKEVKQ